MDKQIIKSHLDTKEYKTFVLDNGMKILLVHDKDIRNSVASMCVKVGTYNEPINVAGIAHFLEHMLFMGSEKYPIENEFEKKINDYSGSTNAFTGNETTQYYFDVSSDYFIDILDIWGQFFIKPLFNESSISREINIVDSEYKGYKNNYVWRENYLKRSIGKKDHVFTRFGVGNIDTLYKNHINLESNYNYSIL